MFLSKASGLFQEDEPEPANLFTNITLDEAKYLLEHFVSLAISKVCEIMNFLVIFFKALFSRRYSITKAGKLKVEFDTFISLFIRILAELRYFRYV